MINKSKYFDKCKYQLLHICILIILRPDHHLHEHDKAIETCKVGVNISKYLQLYQDRIFKSLGQKFYNIQMIVASKSHLQKLLRSGLAR